MSVQLRIADIFIYIIGERAKRARHSQVCSIEIADIYIIYNIIGERAKRARHSQVCSIENRVYIIIYILWYVQILFL